MGKAGQQAKQQFFWATGRGGKGVSTSRDAIFCFGQSWATSRTAFFFDVQQFVFFFPTGRSVAFWLGKAGQQAEQQFFLCSLIICFGGGSKKLNTTRQRRNFVLGKIIF